MLAKDIQGMYSSFDEILSEMKARREDKVLRQKVTDFLGSHGFPFEIGKMHSFFSRSIITPNFELAYFMDLSRDLSLDPILLEYPDKFVAMNPAKYCLTRFHFHKGVSRLALESGVWVGDIAAMEGKRMHELTTSTGESLMDFHHRLLYKSYPELQGKVVDFYKWFNGSRGQGDSYYLCYLALFICDGVLFENFLHDDKEETAFVMEKILPSFNRACEVFGVRPLIFPLLPIEFERQKDWLAYPLSVKDEIRIYLDK